MKETKIKLIHGDITRLNCDAIVNAANSSLLGGGGVDGAIHKAGGNQILNECMDIRNKQGGCKTGDAVITNAGNMKCEKVIHTVGPIWHGGNNNEARLLENCYKNSLKLAVENNLKSIAFPNISTGIYGYPKLKAAEIAIKTVRNFIEKSNDINEIIFVCFDRENYEIYKNII